MDLRQLTPDLAVSPQISPSDVPALAEAGFRTLINNRPDTEVGPDQDGASMARAAEAAGMTYVQIPFVPGEITPQMISAFDQAAKGRPAVAYCRSGNRSAILWALSQAGKQPVADIDAAVAQAGYDITPVLPLIDALAGDRR